MNTQVIRFWGRPFLNYIVDSCGVAAYLSARRKRLYVGERVGARSRGSVKSGVESVKGDAVGDSVSGLVGASPVVADEALAVCVIQGVVPDGLGIGLEEVAPRGGNDPSVQLAQIADEGTLKFLAIAAARGRLIAAVHQDAVGVQKL